MACDWVKVRAPGSIMLFGEHAVLAAEPAMVTAIAQYLTVTVKTRQDNLIDIRSNIFPAHQTTIKELAIINPYTFVLACLMQYKKRLVQGLSIHIDSAIDPTVGLGSSAAATVAMIMALNQLFGVTDPVWPQACNVIRQIQGSGSGMDALASLHGGTLYYNPKTQQLSTLTERNDLHLLYCGYKTPTAKVLQHVRTAFENAPEALQSIYQAMGKTVQQAFHAWQQNDTASLAQCMRDHQSFQKALQVSDEHSEYLCHWLREHIGVEAVKISGAGLGDCLLALGGNWQSLSKSELQALHSNASYIPLTVSQTGVMLVE